MSNRSSGRRAVAARPRAPFCGSHRKLGVMAVWSQAGRLVGIVGAVIVFALWLFLVRYNPFQDPSATQQTLGHALIMIFLALVAMLAALRTKPWLMLSVFLLFMVTIAFYPPESGSFWWFSLPNVLFLLASLLMFKGRAKQR
jgi:hypothetical protein